MQFKNTLYQPRPLCGGTVGRRDDDSALSQAAQEQWPSITWLTQWCSSIYTFFRKTTKNNISFFQNNSADVNKEYERRGTGASIESFADQQPLMSPRNDYFNFGEISKSRLQIVCCLYCMSYPFPRICVWSFIPPRREPAAATPTNRFEQPRVRPRDQEEEAAVRAPSLACGVPAAGTEQGIKRQIKNGIWNLSYSNVCCSPTCCWRSAVRPSRYHCPVSAGHQNYKLKVGAFSK